MGDWITDLVDEQLKQPRNVHVRPMFIDYDDLWLHDLTQGSAYPADDAAIWCQAYESGNRATIPTTYFWYDPRTFIREDSNV